MGMIKSLVVIQWVSLSVLVLGVLTQRFQLLPFRMAFGSFALALLILTLVAIGSLVVLGLTFGPLDVAARTPAILAFLLGLIPLMLVMAFVGAGFRVPKIHDISTDPDLGLTFRHAQSLRSAGENSLEPPSEQVIKLQKEFYQDIAPQQLAQSPGVVFDASLEVMENLDWEITFQDANEGHIEAAERTALFGFTDDVVVKVVQSGEGCVVNVRSVSRLGVSDLGANAKRIRRFQDALEEVLGESKQN